MTVVYPPGRNAGTPEYERILETLDPDADEQRFYTCQGCGWPCINPVGTEPEQHNLCLDCVVDMKRGVIR